MRQLLLFLLAAPLLAQPAFVQGRFCNSATTGANTTCAYSSNITAGHLLVVIARWEETSGEGGPFTATISSSSGVSCAWSQAVPKTQGGINLRNQGLYGAYCIAPSSGAETIQLALSGSASPWKDISISEYSGISSTPYDVVAVAANVGSSGNTACSSGATAALAQTGELAIGACTMWDNSATWGTVSGWTYRSAASSNVFGLYDSVRSNATAVTFSYTLPAADQWMSFAVTFKPAGGATRRRQVVIE